MSSAEPKNDFTRRAQSETPGLVRELWDFLRENKKWWLGPIVAVLLLVGAMLLAGGSAAPFIYALF
ncbi:MAG: DUF5989 family protein [Thermoanaerobaculia bacterium]|nr:DUF5989 family protein [Thermoanaerobaculia bacterium]